MSAPTARDLLTEAAQAVEDLMCDPSWVVLHNHGWNTLKAWHPKVFAFLAESETKKEEESSSPPLRSHRGE